MGTMKFEVPHTLNRAEARARVEQLVDHWSKKYGMTTQWTGDSAKVTGKVMGIAIDAKLDVNDKQVGGEGTDPGFLFREKAKKYLHQKLTAALDPSGYKHD